MCLHLAGIYQTIIDMQYLEGLQKNGWIKGLIWGWIMFAVLTGIDLHNGEHLESREILIRFIGWSIGGIIFWYSRLWLLRKL